MTLVKKVSGSSKELTIIKGSGILLTNNEIKDIRKSNLLTRK